ncbi:hypothetical protein JCM10914A_35790 [Paenibacillus sp. JCM 10914]|nr:hypothetical protein [Paenibacillus sp. JCM 10914]
MSYLSQHSIFVNHSMKHDAKSHIEGLTADAADMLIKGVVMTISKAQ